MRAVTLPAWSLMTMTLAESVSTPVAGYVVTKRKSPVTTSKRTPRAGNGIPPCAMVADTRASPPEQIAGAQAALCAEVGVIVMLLATVPGFTVAWAVAIGVVPVSRAVRITLVSMRTGLGNKVTELPTILPLTGSTAWLFELRM